MTTAIVRSGPVALAPATFEEAQAFATQLAKAEGFIPRAFVGKPAAILAALMMGAELGIGAMESLRAIHVLDGRPMLSADLMLRLALRAGVRATWLRTDAEEAHVKLSRPGHGEHAHRFTMAEARAAGLAGRGPWKAYPAAMLRARCISAALRAWAPDVLGAGVYVEGEIEASEAPPAASLARSVAEAEPAPTWHEERAVDAEELPDEAPPPPPPAMALSDCDTIAKLDGWIGRYGAALRKRGNGGVSRVLEHAAKIGAGGGELAAWRSLLGVEEPSRAHDPDAGEVAPEEEP
jgi:hypothetical protein